MSRLVSVLVLLLVPGTVAGQQPHAWRTRFVITGPVADGPARLDALLSACDAQGAVAALIASEPAGPPLPVVLHERSVSILFGSPRHPRTDSAELQLDLADLERLPTATEVRAWGADSSWAATRCEFLIHEVAEGLEYQHRWRIAGPPASDTSVTARRERLAIYRAAHAFAIAQEDRVARAQATRVDSTGRPYMRRGSCSEPDARRLNLLLGPHTETLTFGAEGELMVAYDAHEDRCALAGIPVLPNVPPEIR